MTGMDDVGVADMVIIVGVGGGIRLRLRVSVSDHVCSDEYVTEPVRPWYDEDLVRDALNDAESHGECE